MDISFKWELYVYMVKESKMDEVKAPSRSNTKEKKASAA